MKIFYRQKKTLEFVNLFPFSSNLKCCLDYRHHGRLIFWLLDWLIDWLIEWLIDWSIDWLIDWFSHVGGCLTSRGSANGNYVLLTHCNSSLAEQRWDFSLHPPSKKPALNAQTSSLHIWVEESQTAGRCIKVLKIVYNFFVD